LLKSDNFIEAVDLAVQAGVNEITPLKTRYTVAGWSANRAKRAERKALSATKQCGRGLVPRLNDVQHLDKWCIEDKKEKRFLFSQDGNTLPTIEPGTEVRIAVGCEGGFSEEEEEFLISKGFESISLGSRRLRSEAAVITAISRILSR
jgi:16S rRNA (uracil1498-N3)-methyltransferase